MTLCVGPHDTTTEAKTGYLCTRHRNQLSSLLVQIPSLAVWLHANITPSTTAGERVSGSREEPIPLRLDILDYVGPTASRELSETMGTTRREPKANGELERVQIGEPSLLDVIGSWALLVSEERADDWPDTDDLASLCRWLHRQLDWVVVQPWVDDMLENLADTARKAERLAPRDAEVRRLKAACPSCDKLALVFTRGIGVKCETRMTGCGRSWEDDGTDGNDYDRLIVVLGASIGEAV